MHDNHSFIQNLAPFQLELLLVFRVVVGHSFVFLANEVLALFDQPYLLQLQTNLLVQFWIVLCVFLLNWKLDMYRCQFVHAAGVVLFVLLVMSGWAGFGVALDHVFD